MAYSSETLQLIVDQSIDYLEDTLIEKSFTRLLGKDLQLRYSQCGLATIALKQWLNDNHDIDTMRLIGTPSSTPRWHDGYQMPHVILRHDSMIIDPTFSQFYSYIGLSAPDASTNSEIKNLYPPSKIAVIPDTEAIDFSRGVAASALELREQLRDIDIRKVHHPPDNVLASATINDVQRVYEDIWSLKYYSEVEEH